MKDLYAKSNGIKHHKNKHLAIETVQPQDLNDKTDVLVLCLHEFTGNLNCQLTQPHNARTETTFPFSFEGGQKSRVEI